MKRISACLVLLFVTQTCFSQTIEIAFQDYIGINTGLVRDYEEIINPKNHVVVEPHIFTQNRYLIDLENKSIELYYSDELLTSQKIYKYEQKGNLLFMECSDREDSTGKSITSHFVLNTNEKSDPHPLFVMFFVSSVTNTTNGFIVKNTSQTAEISK